MANIDKELAKIKAANWGGDLRTSMADALVKVNEERSGTLDYEDLNNKPQINSVELTGNKTLQQIGAEEMYDEAKTEHERQIVDEWINRLSESPQEMR